MSAVQSVDRALTLLGILAAEGECGVTDLAGRIGVHKSTVSRLLEALEEHELVTQLDGRGKYRLGVGLLRLASATNARLDVVSESRAVTRALAEHTGETVNIAVLSDGAALYVDQVGGASPHQAHYWVGQRNPLHATSNGKVLLSGLSDDQVLATLADPLPAYTPTTITDPQVLLGQLDRVRREGVSVVADELEPGLVAAAAAIRNVHGEVVASMSVSGPSFRFRDEALARAAHEVRRAADDVSARLGWRPTTR